MQAIIGGILCSALTYALKQPEIEKLEFKNKDDFENSRNEINMLNSQLSHFRNKVDTLERENKLLKDENESLKDKINTLK